MTKLYANGKLLCAFSLIISSLVVQACQKSPSLGRFNQTSAQRSNPARVPVRQAVAGRPDASQSIITGSIASRSPLTQAKGEVIGSGPIRVAMLLPSSAPGNAGKVAQQMRNAALMAMEDRRSNAIELVIKDSEGLPGPATDRAGEALADGTSLVLGPLFAGNVAAVSGVLRPAGRPMIAFSSDARTASRGVYLMSFLPESLIDRIMRFTSGQKIRSVVAVLPKGPYGNLAKKQMHRTLGASGVQILGTVEYAPNQQSIDAAARQIAHAASQADAIFIPEGGKFPSQVLTTLKRYGVPVSRKKILGTGQWASSKLSNPLLQGAWFADIDRTRLGQFKTRYKQKYGHTPALTAVLAYDSVAMANGLAQRAGAAGFSPRQIESNAGAFNGYGGIFRFTANGTTQRNLSIYEVRNGRAIEIESPPSARETGY